MAKDSTRRVVYGRYAQQDLLSIVAYIAKDRPTASSQWIDHLDHTLGRLAKFPHSGSVPRDERLAKLGYRMVIIGNYLAFYLVRGRRVEIRRVLHGRQHYAFLY